MRSLFDVNVLLALFDANHSSHEAAFEWFAAHGAEGWATCPITQNGFIRVMSQPAYLNVLPISAVADRLRDAVRDPHHEFWPDALSLLDCADPSRIHGPNDVTDAYLLGLAVSRGGRLVTFDRSITVSAVPAARSQNLVVL